MDIAKIKKKLKQSEKDNQHSQINSTTEENQTHVTASDEKSPESSVIEKPAIFEPVESETTQDQGSAHKEEIKEEKVETKAGRIEDKIENYKADEVIEILSFSLLKEEFAFRISQLEEILKYQRITSVPKMPIHVIGITSLRGKVIPVIDLKLKLSLTDRSSRIDHKGKILILKGPKGQIGAVVDKVIGVLRIAKSEILPPPSHLTETELKFIEGVTVLDKRFISLINMEEAVAI